MNSSSIKHCVGDNLSSHLMEDLFLHFPELKGSLIFDIHSRERANDFILGHIGTGSVHSIYGCFPKELFVYDMEQTLKGFLAHECAHILNNDRDLENDPKYSHISERMVRQNIRDYHQFRFWEVLQKEKCKRVITMERKADKTVLSRGLGYCLYLSRKYTEEHFGNCIHTFGYSSSELEKMMNFPVK